MAVQEGRLYLFIGVTCCSYHSSLACEHRQLQNSESGYAAYAKANCAVIIYCKHPSQEFCTHFVFQRAKTASEINAHFV